MQQKLCFGGHMYNIRSCDRTVVNTKLIRLKFIWCNSFKIALFPNNLCRAKITTQHGIEHIQSTSDSGYGRDAPDSQHRSPEEATTRETLPSNLSGFRTTSVENLVLLSGDSGSISINTHRYPLGFLLAYRSK